MTAHPATVTRRGDLVLPLTVAVTTTIVMTVVAAALFATHLSRGLSRTGDAAIAVAALMCAAVTVLLARFVSFETPAPRRARSIATGMMGTGIVVTAASAASGFARSGGWGVVEGAGLVTGILLMAAAIPAAAWLAPHRLEASVDAVIARGATFPTSWGPFTLTDVVVIGILVVVTVVSLLTILPDGPFGHDESIYALKARSWVSGTPATGFEIYRPPGMPVIGILVLAFGDTETAFRTAASIISVAVVTTMWVSGRLMFDRLTATLGTVLFLSTASFLRRATEFLNDVGAAGLMLAALTVLWFHFERKPGGWWIVAAAPLAAAAYYMRYGSALGLLTIAVVAGVIWRGRLRVALVPIAVTAGVLALLLVPHLLHSASLTGGILGIFRSASTSVGGGGGGLGHYLGWLPEELAGRLGFAALLAALAYTAVVAVRASRGEDPVLAAERRTTLYLVVVAVAVTIELGAFTHGEPRFVFLPMMAAILVGARATASVVGLLRRHAATVAMVVLGITLIGALAAGVIRAHRLLDGITAARSVIVEAADAVVTDARGAVCGIRSSYVPELTWYTSCATYAFDEEPPSEPASYLVVFANGVRQPTGDDLVAELRLAEIPPVASIIDPRGSVGDATVFRLTPQG